MVEVPTMLYPLLSYIFSLLAFIRHQSVLSLQNLSYNKLELVELYLGRF